MKRTNYFSGFEHKPRHFEDQLTRAFLVLLRLVPPVQSTFIDYIRDEQLRNGSTHVVPPRSMCATAMNSIWTQTGSLKTDKGRVLSILLINKRQNIRTTIRPSDRTAVYDGVVHYGDGWIFAMKTTNVYSLKHVPARIAHRMVNMTMRFSSIPSVSLSCNSSI